MSSNLESEVQCSICHETFDDPRFLVCYHSFCFECVQVLAVGKSRVSCPLCRKETTLPSSGASGLTKNNLAQFVASTLGHKRGSSVRHRHAICQSDGDEHDPPQKAIFYCESCKKAVCANCVVIYHRDPINHLITNIDLAVDRMKEEINGLLSHGQKLVSRRTKSRKLLKSKETDVSKRVAELQSQITSVFEEERKKLENRENALTRELKNVGLTITNVLRDKQANSDNEVKSLSELNCLAKDVLQGGACAITEMYGSIREGYEQDEAETFMPTKLDETAASLEQISGFLSKIRFQKAPDTKQQPEIGKIYVMTGDWLLEQIRYATTMLPTCVAKMSDGAIAVGFESVTDIKIYNKHLQCTKVFGPVAVKHMIPLTDTAILVLTQYNDIFRFSSPKQYGTRLCAGDNLPNPVSISANVAGHFSLIYKDHIKMYDISGKLVRKVLLPLYLGDRSLETLPQNSSKNQNINVLLKNDKSLKLINIMISPKIRLSTCEVNLPGPCPDGQDRIVTLDNAGNLYVATVKDKKYVTIKKYWGCSMTSEEVVITDLQIMLDAGDRILLSALSPSCLVMSTPKKLSVFRKCKVEQFLT